jgi:putative protease
LKIEGRAKSAYYLANVVGAYRQAIDLMYSKKTKAEQNQELNFLRGELEQKLSHRGYCEGFMFRSSDSLQNTSGVNFVPDWEFCGQVLSCKAGKGFYDLKIKVHNTLKVGDKLEIVAPPYQVEALVLEKITDAKTGKDLKEVHGGSAVGGEVIIRSDKPFPAFSVIRRRL